VDAIATTLVDGFLVPLIAVVTAPIPFLAASGVLLLVFGVMWLALGAAIVREPARVDAVWHRIRALPLVVQAIAWLLFLPVLAGVWVWRTGWPRPARVTVVGLLACWNLVMFLPAPA
jgi:hypothetical protein